MCRVLARGVLLLLAIGATSAKPQYGGTSGGVSQQPGGSTVWWQDNTLMAQLSQSCGSQPNFQCVDHRLCVNGIINSAGIGQIDQRYGGGSGVPADSVYPRCPQFGEVCCQHEIVNYDYDYGDDQCGAESQCVNTYQCDDSGFINTSGIGLIDVRVRNPNETRSGPLTPCVDPDYPDLPAVCCRTTVKDQVYSKCLGGTVCQDTFACDSGAQYGSHIDASYIDSECYLPNKEIGTCCAPKFQLHQTCPGGTICQDATQCEEGYPYDVRNVDKSFFNQKCAWGSAGGVGVCCAKRETVHTTCPGGTVCEKLSQCATGYDYDTTISTSLFNSACYWGAGNERGVCCAPKLTVHDPCPGHMVCTNIQNCRKDYAYPSHVDITSQNELCHYDRATGARGVCCAPELIHDTCPGNTVCSSGNTCNANWKYPKNVDSSVFGQGCWADATNKIKGVCCAPKFHDHCPGNTVCSTDTSCAANWQYPANVDSSIFGQGCWADATKNIPGVCCAPKPYSYGQCNPSNSYCTTQANCGSGGNVRYTENSALCYTDSGNTQLGVCCGLQHYDTCPGNSYCSFEAICPGKLLDVTNNYIPWQENTLYPTCKIEHGDGITGVCCEGSGEGSPIIDPIGIKPAIEKCGVQQSAYIKTSAYTPTPEIDTRVKDYGINLQKDEAQFGEFPWQAIVFYANYTYKCGATLIDERHVITGAHCVYDLQYTPHDTKVRLGEYKVNGFDEPDAYTDVNVEKILIHPRYKPGALWNNIAVMVLDRPVEFKYHILPLCLPERGYSVPPGTRCWVAGWGKDSFTGQYQHTIKKIDLPVVSHHECQALLRKTRLREVFLLHRNFMCAGGEKGRDACTGDGGGALSCFNPASGVYELIGIVSWGIGCGEQNIPAVYADVPKAMRWVNSVIPPSKIQTSKHTSPQIPY